MGKQSKKKKIKVEHAAGQATKTKALPPSPVSVTGIARRNPPGTRPVLLISIILFLGVMAVFWPCVKNQFINYDDGVYVTENIHVIRGLSASSIAWAFTSGEESNWHPLTWLSHMVDCNLYGLKPAGHHFTNILLHSINVVLLFLVLKLMTGATWRSLAVATLFGLHPLRVESVAWAAERKDVLSTAFWLLTMWAYVRYAQMQRAKGSSQRYYILTLVFFILALLSKPMVVTLPFILLLMDIWPLQRVEQQGWRKLITEKAPLFCLALVSCVITYEVQQHGGAVQNDIPLNLRLETALVSYFSYLEKMLWPSGLSILYPYPDQWPAAIVVACAIGLAAISLGLLVYRKKLPWLGIGWFWYLGTLVPVIGLVQIGVQSMADRYTYIPSIGIAILLVWSTAALLEHWRLSPRVWKLVVALLLVACMIVTRRQIGYWNDSKTIFTHALEINPKNAIAYLKLGVFLYGNGEHDAAIHVLETGVTEMPGTPSLRNNLGFYYREQGRFSEAETQLREALRLFPDYPEADASLAYLCFRSGRREEGISLARHALEVRPDYPFAQKLLAWALGNPSATIRPGK